MAWPLAWNDWHDAIQPGDVFVKRWGERDLVHIMLPRGRHGKQPYMILDSGNQDATWNNRRNKLWRWAARVSKLAEGDYQVKQWECLIDDLETFVAVHRTELVKRRGGEKVKQRIKLLEMVTIENGATKGEQENARRAIETLREKTT
jgi:hypothetical protein